jgi:hypothetical protein
MSAPLIAEREFADGTHVRRLSNPDQSGIVIGARWSGQRKEWDYRVQFGIQVRAVSGDDLEVVRAFDPWGDAARGVLAGADAFREALTYHRLRRPPGRIRASFGTARATFYPFQFKPLLKLMEHPRQRLLIADDVGLGKTIEAGYILRELHAHQALDRVLVVCPARLRKKWQDELAQRFDERFDLVGGPELANFGKTLQRSSDPPSLRWLVSYESARTESFIQTLLEYEPYFDLVIFDEAHRLRNPGTLQNALGRALGGCAGAMVFLTATPIQTGEEDLFNLLHILDSDTFQRYSEFQAQMEANRPIVRAMTHLRSAPPNAQGAADCLDQLADNRFTHHLSIGDFMESLRGRVARAETLTRSDLVALQRDISELSLTNSILSRTRKVEVMPERPHREAMSVTIEFTAAERRIYAAVESICQRVSPMGAGGWGQSMPLLMAYRYTASCIPAAVELFQQRLSDTGNVFGASREDETEDANGWIDVPDGAGGRDTPFEGYSDESMLVHILHHGTAGLPDTKFDKFLQALREIWAQDIQANRATRKVIVFSFFKRTLRYLNRRLTGEKIGTTQIDGDIPIDERLLRIDDFANRDAVRVLLTSEVGGEGIDLQFASVIVNYDLPWNPMVVEQRIGRIDRIGQKSPILTIINFAIANTIETRILLRLYDRIEIFKESIGEIDPIVGNRVLELTIQALRGDLSAEDQERQAEQTALAALDEMQRAHDLVNRADGLLASDQAFLDEIEAMVGQRRVPTPDELYVFVRRFLAGRYHGTHLPVSVLDAVDKVVLPGEVATDLREQLGGDAGALLVARRIDQGQLHVTMSQDVAVRHPKADLMHSRHPLVRLATKLMEAAGTVRPQAFMVELASEDWPKNVDLARDRAYLFSVRLLEFNGARPRTEVLAVFMAQEGDHIFSGEAAQDLVVRMLAKGRDALHVAPEWQEAADRFSGLLEAASDDLKDQIEVDEKNLNEIRQQRRVATLEATCKLRIEHARARLRLLEEREAAAFSIRMAQAKLKKLESDWTASLRELDAGTTLRLIADEVAIGILHIR